MFFFKKENEILIYTKLKNKKIIMDYQDKYDALVNLLTEGIEIDGKKYNLKDDFEKFFVRGNKTAGTRIRRMMQELKKLSGEIRKDVQDYKSKI
jgi:hypothetical protein